MPLVIALLLTLLSAPLWGAPGRSLILDGRMLSYEDRSNWEKWQSTQFVLLRDFTTTQLAEVLPCLKCVTHLTLFRSQISEESLAGLADDVRLKSLGLFLCSGEVRMSPMVYVQLEHIENVSIVGCDTFTSTLADEVQMLPRLKHFEVGECGVMDDESVALVVGSHQLETLVLRRQTLSRSVANAVRRQSRLRALTVSGCTWSRDCAPDHMLPIPTLESLTFRRMPMLPSSVVDNIFGNSRLRHVDVSDTALSDYGLRRLNMGILDTLDVSSCSALSPRWPGLLKLAHQLRVLVARNLTIRGNADVGCRSSTRLEMLDLSECTVVGRHAILSLLLWQCLGVLRVSGAIAIDLECVSAVLENTVVGVVECFDVSSLDAGAVAQLRARFPGCRFVSSSSVE